MKVHETRSHAHTSGGGDEKIMTRKQKAESRTQESQQSPKKTKAENEDGHGKPKSEDDAVAEFDEFCKTVREHLSVRQMREVLQANGLDSSAPETAVIYSWDVISARELSWVRPGVTDFTKLITVQDLLFYGPLDKCPACNGTLVYTGTNYTCTGSYSEWSSCTFTTRDPPRKMEVIKLPDSVLKSDIADLLKKYQDPGQRPRKNVATKDKPFLGMMISLSGRLSRTHQYWKKEIERHGGQTANTIRGVTCLVVSVVERERGGSSKVVEALESQIPVVREEWLADSIARQEPQPLKAYNVASDLSAYGRGTPLDKQDAGEEALETLSAELKLYGKRAVYKDTMLRDQGAKIFERDGISYNCAFSLCDLGRGINEYCIMQLVMVPENHLYLYYKKGKVGDDPGAEERREEWDGIENCINEFVRLFEEITGNEFEPWEREKKFQKKPGKFYPIDMDDGVDVRYGGLGVRQLGAAAAHCKLEPLVANFMKVLCSQEIYRYAMMEMGYDAPDLPMGMLSSVHLKRCEEVLLEFVERVKSTKETGHKAEAIWSDYSQRWFTLMHSTRPMIFRNHQELAEHAAAPLEGIRDICVASHLIGDLTGSIIDDPLSDVYNRLACSITPLEKDSDDYKMLLKYLEKTYEPVKLGEISYNVSVENIFCVESGAQPSYDEIKKLPNKVLLWCGTRSSNVMRHLHEGFLPAICSLPVPGYMFGKAVVCSDAAAEAARYGFTSVDRPEGFLVVAVAALGEQITELKSPPEDTRSLEEKKMGVKGLGRKTTDEKEHFMWKDDIKVPCGRLVPSREKDSPLEYNEYAVYDPKQASIRFLVAVKFEEKDVVYDTEE